MCDRVKWIIKFLKEYRRFPCLWKKASPDFKIRTKRNKAEEELLKLSGLKDIKLLRSKIRSIRCTYNQEVVKIKNSKSSGLDAGEVYVPKLQWFYVADSFLRQNLEENEAESKLKLPENSLVVDQGYEESILKTKEVKQEPFEIVSSNNPEVVEAMNRRKTCANFTQRTTKRKRKVDDSLDKAVESLKQIAEQKLHVATNEFTCFGQHIASQLQCIPLEEALILQEKIQRLLTAARLRSIYPNQKNLLDCPSTSRHN